MTLLARLVRVRTSMVTPIPDADPFLEHFLPGNTPEVARLRRTISRLNRQYKNRGMGRNVLILGETGAGKTHLARVIAGHLYWLREPTLWGRDGTHTRTIFQLTSAHFVELAVPNLPDDLIEAELFGHTKGAFTGATSDKAGYFGSADIQDLLLDEIGDASPRLQAKLLQVLNDGQFKPVGAPPDAYQITHVRVFLATNRDLELRIANGDFRDDLYWRMQDIVVHVPPLRAQADRIPTLANALVAKVLRQNGEAPDRLHLGTADVDWARQQAWPGNVRELERLIWKWVWEDGERSLAEVHEDCGYGRRADPSVNSTVRGVIKQRIAQALRAGHQLADTPGGLVKDIVREARESLYAIKQELQLERADLDALFTSSDGRQVAKQISAWRSKEQSE